MKITLPASVRMIIDMLEHKGFEAYAVGGCVRDSVLGREPDDWDITTSAKPLEVKRYFDRTVDTGLSHGTITVLIGSHAHEVTTYRVDGTYTDGRHPDAVAFTASLNEDLRRRDFTINAMAYNDHTGLVDIYGGMEDLQKHVIRCVGAPDERFGEDALRILRAVRFAAQLDFTIEEETFAAVRTLAGTLAKISAERIAVELVKLLVSDHPDYVGLLYSAGITGVILPEFDAMMDTPAGDTGENVGIHTLRALKAVEADRVLRLAVLLHDVGKTQCADVANGNLPSHGEAGEQMAKRIMRRLRLDNTTIYEVSTLIRWHSFRAENSMYRVRQVMSRIGPKLFDKLIKVKYADITARKSGNREAEQDELDFLKHASEAVIEQKDCISLGELAIDGQDLIACGMRPGPEIGRTLYRALEKVLEDPEVNDREYLLRYLGCM